MWFLTSIDRYLAYALTTFWQSHCCVKISFSLSLARITVHCEKRWSQHTIPQSCEQGKNGRRDGGGCEKKKPRRRRRKELSQNKEHQNGDDDDFSSSPHIFALLPAGMSYDNSSSSPSEMFEWPKCTFLDSFLFSPARKPAHLHSNNVPNMAFIQHAECEWNSKFPKKKYKTREKRLNLFVEDENEKKWLCVVFFAYFDSKCFQSLKIQSSRARSRPTRGKNLTTSLHADSTWHSLVVALSFFRMSSTSERKTFWILRSHEFLGKRVARVVEKENSRVEQSATARKSIIDM